MYRCMQCSDSSSYNSRFEWSAMVKYYFLLGEEEQEACACTVLVCFKNKKKKKCRTKKEGVEALQGRGLLVYKGDEREEIKAFFFYYCHVYGASSDDNNHVLPHEQLHAIRSKSRRGVNLCKCNQYAVDPEGETSLKFHRLVKHCYDKMLNRCSSPFIWTVDHQTNLLSNTTILLYPKGQTNINKCIRTRLNVQCRRCPNHEMFKRGGKRQPGVVYSLCSVSVGMLL